MNLVWNYEMKAVHTKTKPTRLGLHELLIVNIV